MSLIDQDFKQLLKSIDGKLDEVVARLDVIADLLEAQQDPPATFSVEGWVGEDDERFE